MAPWIPRRFGSGHRLPWACQAARLGSRSSAAAGDPVDIASVATRWIGGALAIAFVLWNGWTLWVMATNRHSDPAGRGDGPVLQSGPFRLSRNPLYVGLVALDVAVALLSLVLGVGVRADRRCRPLLGGDPAGGALPVGQVRLGVRGLSGPGSPMALRGACAGRAPSGAPSQPKPWSIAQPSGRTGLAPSRPGGCAPGCPGAPRASRATHRPHPHATDGAPSASRGADRERLVGHRDVPAGHVSRHHEAGGEVRTGIGAREVVPHDHVDRSHLELVGGVGELPALLAHPVEPPGPAPGPPQPVPPPGG